MSGPVAESDVNQLVKTSPALQCIHLFFFTRVHEVLRQIADQCPLLEELKLQCSFLMDDFLYLLSKCSVMKDLSLNYDPFKEWTGENWDSFRPYGHLIQQIGIYSDTVNPPAFADFVSACPRLRHLDYFDMPETVDGQILLHAAQSCPLLENLDCETHSTAAMSALAQNCKKLRHVRIHYTPLPMSASDLTILKQIETLETLMLEQEDLTNAHMTAICQFRNLKELEMQNCYFDDIVTEGMFVDTPISRTLEKIDIAVRHASALSRLTPCTKLRGIDLGQIYGYTNADLMMLAAHFPLLENVTIGYVQERIISLTYFITQHKHLKKVFLIPFHNPQADVGAEVCFQGRLNDLRTCFRHIRFLP